MKKIVLLLFIAGFMMLALFPPCSHASGEKSETKSLDTAVSEIRGPESLARFMRKEFQFREDKDLFGREDYWQSPAEFWQKKSGDCEDYAIFAQYVLKRLGYEVYVISFYDEFGAGHTVALYRDGGFYNIIDEDKILRFNTRTLEESLTSFYPAWAWGAVAEQRGTRGWLLQKLMPA